MADGRSRKAAVEETTSMKDRIAEDSMIVADNSSLESKIALLRGRWELASILNFLSVFEPVIGSDLKLTAEEIETGLVKPNSSLAQLHIKLLKGIPPVSKTLNNSDAWVTVLCKKLAMWWSWVAEGEMPLTAAKGQEISGYKGLDPTNRLQILKALCEIRANQNDAVSYINDALKNGAEISCFRKYKIGGDGNATSYWYDGSTIIGHRLYKEVIKAESKAKLRGQAPKSLPATCSQWETLATNLEEFKKIVVELSSSRVAAEVGVGKTIETGILPDIEKFQKKKQRALKRKQMQEKLLNDSRSYGAGFTRSCRHNRPISYTFDDYDRAINEAIKLTKRRTTTEEQRKEKKHNKLRKISSNEGSSLGTDSREIQGKKQDSNMDTDSKDGNVKRGNSLDSEAENDRLQAGIDDDDDGDSDDDYVSKKDVNENDSESGNSDEQKDNLGDQRNGQKPVGSRWSKRLAGVTSHPVVETRNLGTKNWLRQRPTWNSALDLIVPDSDDENLSKHANNGISAHRYLSPVGNSEEVGDS